MDEQLKCHMATEDEMGNSERIETLLETNENPKVRLCSSISAIMRLIRFGKVYLNGCNKKAFDYSVIPTNTVASTRQSKEER